MQSKYAKAIARNLRTIAENSARIALIDARIGTGPDAAEHRVELSREIELSESRIAAILLQPGARLTA